MTTRPTPRRFVVTTLLALALSTAVSAGPALADRYDDRYDDHRRGNYNSEYIFVATKTVADMDVHPVAKVPLFPERVILNFPDASVTTVPLEFCKLTTAPSNGSPFSLEISPSIV